MDFSLESSIDPVLITAARLCFRRQIDNSTNPSIEEILAELAVEPGNANWDAIVLDLLPEEVLYRQALGRVVILERELERFPELASRLERVLAPLLQQTSSLESLSPSAGPSVVPAPASPSLTVRDSRECDSPTVLDTLPPRSPTAVGRYKLLEPLGRGGCGEVWLAHDPQLDRKVAVKLIRRDRIQSGAMLDDLIREGRRVASLKHPGVLPVFDAGQIDGTMYLVSEFCRHGTLKNLLVDGPVAPKRAAEVGALIADALHHAHLNGIVHRDIKPQNILLDDDRRPRLTDFGIAVTEDELVAERPATLGTYAYMSPEQLSGQSHLADSRSDIYSLGVVLYELLTGRVPFLGKNYEQYREQVLTREARPPRTIQDSIPAELEQIVLRCMAKSLHDRFTTAADVASALRSIRWSTSRRTKWARAALAAGAAVLVAGLFWGPKAWSLLTAPSIAESPPASPRNPEQPPRPSLEPGQEGALGEHVELTPAQRHAPLWVKHFGMAPTELMWPGARGRRDFVWSKETPALTLLSKSALLVQFSSIPATGDRQLSVRIEHFGNWTCGGIFWDYREFEFGAETVAAMEIVEIQIVPFGTEGREVSYHVSRSIATIDPKDAFITRRGTRSMLIPIPARPTSLLEFEFKDRQLSRFRMNDTDYPELTAPPPADGQADLPPPLADGLDSKWGGLTDYGSLSFRID